MINLSAKKILFIAPVFYHYHKEIVKSLEVKGAIVDFYPEMEHTFLYKISNKISRQLNAYLTKRYINNILKNIKFGMYDIVFIIRGGYFSTASLEELHIQLPKAKFYMYQWDSVEQNNYLHLIKYFDKVQTFDMLDAKKYNLEYLPLFFTEHFKEVQKTKDKKLYDLIFFGAYHSDRLEIVKYFDELFKKNNLIFKSHLYVTKLALLRLLITRAVPIKDLHYLSTYSMPLRKMIEIYKSSYAVLDVELFIQNGLTMRTFETLGANLKLLTTNKNILQESFYSSKNIMYIDRNKIEVNLDFFQKTGQESCLYEEYHIDSWLENIFTLDRCKMS